MVKSQVNTTIIDPHVSTEERCRAFARASSGRYWTAYLEGTLFATESILAAYSDDGITWIEELVYGPVPAATLEFRPLSLVIDSGDIPHILFELTGGGDRRYLMHTDRATGVWMVPELAYDVGAGVTILFHNVCIDGADVIHIALTGHTTPNIIRHIYGTTGVWNNEVAYNSLNGVGSNLVIATDSLNNLFIIWAESGGPLRILAVYTIAGVWQAPEVVSVNYGWAFTMTFDLLDNLLVAWLRTAITDCIQYCRRFGGVWGAEIDAVHDFDGIVNLLPPSITVDTDGNAYIICQKDDHGGDEAVYYKKVSATGILGPITILDAVLLMPNTQNSVFSSLWSGGSNSSILDPVFYPLALLLDEDNSLGFPFADLYFEIAAILPTVQTDPATMVTQLTARLNSTLIADGGEVCACGFEWGRTIAYGNTTPTQNRVAGQTFSQDILALLDSTTYHFRAFAINSYGTVYGADRTLTTSPAGSFVCPYDGTIFTSWGTLYIHLLTVHGVYICTHCGAIFSTWGALYSHLATHGIFSAQVMTLAATMVTENAARINGIVIEDLGVISETRFQWGLTTEYGMNTPWQHGYARDDTFFVNLTGLGEGTAFHFRAQMRNQGGVVSGNDMAFNTLSPLGPVTLIDDELIYLLEAV